MNEGYLQCNFGTLLDCQIAYSLSLSSAEN